jgi:glycosyltransferase 2 family protein
MDEPDNTLSPAPKSLRRFIQPALGYLVAAACLFWVLHDVHLREILSVSANIQWRWVTAAIAFDLLSYICQGWRWQLLLRPVGRISLVRATQAIYAGLFTNEMLPMRLGEVVRVYLVSQWMPSGFASVVPSLIVERFFDAVWLAICMGLAAVFVPLPQDLARAGDILGAAVLLATVLFLYVVYRKREDRLLEAAGASPGWRLLRLARRVFESLEEGIRKIGFSKGLYLSFVASLLFVICQTLALWLIMQACGLKLSFWVGAVVYLVVRLGTALPNAPANLGTYQFFVVVGLEIFGVGKGPATGFSFVVFFLLTFPLWVIGFFALSQSRMTLASIRANVRKVTSQEPGVSLPGIGGGL